MILFCPDDDDEGVSIDLFTIVMNDLRFRFGDRVADGGLKKIIEHLEEVERIYQALAPFPDTPSPDPAPFHVPVDVHDKSTGSAPPGPAPSRTTDPPEGGDRT